VATPADDDARQPRRAKSCADCGSRLGEDQKYCLECGARRGPLPPAIANRLTPLLAQKRAEEKPAAEPEPESESKEEEQKGLLGFMPNPRAAAVAVMGMLAFGVLLGSAISPLAQSAGLYSILLEEEPPEPVAEAEEPVSEPEPEPEAAEAPFAETSSTIPPEVVEEGSTEPELPKEPPPEEPVEELPEVKHVFLIVLGENGYEESFGKAASSPYLAKTLAKKGEVLTNYYAVAQSDLANQIALISGQGPTPETAADCPSYGDIAPGTESVFGQVEGNGCIYPATTKSLPSQLVAKKLKWKAYVEGIDNDPAQATSCRHPVPDVPPVTPEGTPPTKEAPVPGNAYLTWRNPFVYFHSILDQWPEVLQGKGSKAPALSYIVPDACHTGGPVPCEPGKPTGPAASEEFLETVVPAILASAAYKENGLIAITSSLAPQSGEHPDSSACCVVPEYSNMPPAPPAEPSTGPVKPSGGGGRVGMLLISPFVKPGTVNETGYFNHFTTLLTIEELFELEKLGYANELALVPFDSTVFNFESSEAAE
jgi:hypothetical protein